MKTANWLLFKRFFIVKLLTYILYNFNLSNCSMSLSYHKHIHNSIKFCLISLGPIISNHHLPCTFPLLGTDCPRLTVADKRLWKGIGLRYLVLRCQLVCIGEVGNKRVKFPHNCLIPCVEGGGLFSGVIIENTFLFIS